jgi:hypothetical protein
MPWDEFGRIAKRCKKLGISIQDYFRKLALKDHIELLLGDP